MVLESRLVVVLLASSVRLASIPQPEIIRKSTSHILILASWVGVHLSDTAPGRPGQGLLVMDCFKGARQGGVKVQGFYAGGASLR
jgi:hypothetical protein